MLDQKLVHNVMQFRFEITSIGCVNNKKSIYINWKKKC